MKGGSFKSKGKHAVPQKEFNMDFKELGIV